MPESCNSLEEACTKTRSVPVVLDEKSFRRVLSLERKRTERSKRMFLLMLLDVTRQVEDQEHTKKLNDVFSALSSSLRDTDAIGWHTRQTTVGIIFTEISPEARNSISGQLRSRISGILYENLSFEEFNQISISQYLFPEEWDHDVPLRPSHPTLYPDLSERDASGRLFSTTKRAIDILGSVLGLLLLSPVFLVIALAIKLSSKGPVLFRQVRVGQFGKPFVFLKFRSMYVGNSSTIHRDYVTALINGQAERKQTAKGDGSLYKLTRDPRVTRIGLFLRKSSLDELPQLYNVLIGEMSLVGPRPAIPYEVEAYELWHRRRLLEAKPGITGLWQVKGRSRVTFDEMVRLDVRYAINRSLWLDLKILIQTPRAVLFGVGAC